MNSDANTTDEYIASQPTWQAENLRIFRKLVLEVAPEATEEIKWGVPTFTVGGRFVFAMATFKSHTKYNFALNGALLDDKDGLFNNGLESKKSRGIDMKEGESVDEATLKDLITQSLALVK